MLKVIKVQSSNKALVRLALASQKVNASTVAPTTDAAHTISRESFHNRIGNREIVGFGINGRPVYFDHPTIPLPAVRWSPNTAELASLREKAKGDWGKFSLEEKKALYRADFCQTLSEASEKGKGEWKFILGNALGFVGTSMWLYLLFQNQIYTSPKLETSTLEHQTRMLERMIAQGIGRVHGYSSEWDYEKGQWKK